MSLGDLIRRHEFEPVTRSYRERFGDDLTMEFMECIRKIVVDPAAKQLGGTAQSPWSDATWLMWLRNRAVDHATKSCEELLSEIVEREFALPDDVQSWTEFLRTYSAEILALAIR
jgi:hypothetical protein